MSDATPTEESSEPVHDVSHFYASYQEYNKVLRTWFVAFGVGGPAFFLVNAELGRKLATFGLLREIVALFLVGAAAQVLGAVLNKVANWYTYVAYTADGELGTVKHRFWEFVAGQFWLDVVLDLISIFCFGRASWLLFTTFAL